MFDLFFQEYFYASTAPKIKMLNKTIVIGGKERSKNYRF